MESDERQPREKLTFNKQKIKTVIVCHIYTQLMIRFPEVGHLPGSRVSALFVKMSSAERIVSTKGIKFRRRAAIISKIFRKQCTQAQLK